MIGMAMRTQLVQRQELRQTLTPQQRQLVDVIELPDQSIDGYLREALASNPALQRRPDAGFLRDHRSEAGGAAPSAAEEGWSPLEARAVEELDLMAHLVSQFRLERFTDAEERAAMVLMGNLNEHGLLELPLEDVAQAADVGLHDAESAQMIVMELDPVGCGACDLSHYYGFMVRRLFPEDPFFPDMVRDHLDELQRQRFDLVASAMDMDREDVEEYFRMLVEEIPPFPARGYGDVREAGAALVQRDQQQIQPTMDVQLAEEEPEGLKVVMHEDARPPVRVDPRFEQRIAQMEEGPERREAIEQLEKARIMVRSLEERHSLVKQIAEIAVRRQVAYFQSGDKAELQNLTMAEVAEELNRDTSTVSRAVAGRYYTWASETHALRDLFVNRGGGQDTSADALKAAIQALIDEEDKRKPLSDAAIAKLLARRGMDGVARRTIAKYRDLMGVRSSRDRKQR